MVILNTPYIGSSIKCAPLCKINDGENHIIIQTNEAGRIRLAQVLVRQDSGDYFQEDGSFKTCVGIEYVKCTQWRLDPLLKANPKKRKESKEQSQKSEKVEKKKTFEGAEEEVK